MKNPKVWMTIFVICFVAAAIFTAMPAKTPASQPIDMIQPCGWWVCKDYDMAYAEHVNLPNSKANLNNSKATLNFEQSAVTKVETVGIGLAVGWVGNIALVTIVLGGLFLLKRAGKL